MPETYAIICREEFLYWKIGGGYTRLPDLIKRYFSLQEVSDALKEIKETDNYRKDFNHEYTSF